MRSLQKWRLAFYQLHGWVCFQPKADSAAGDNYPVCFFRFHLHICPSILTLGSSVLSWNNPLNIIENESILWKYIWTEVLKTLIIYCRLQSEFNSGYSHDSIIVRFCISWKITYISKQIKRIDFLKYLIIICSVNVEADPFKYFPCVVWGKKLH